MRNLDHHKMIDPLIIFGIDRIERQVVRYGNRRNERVIRSSTRFAPCGSKTGRNLSKSTRRRGIKRQGIEICFRLLQPRLAGGPFGVGFGGQGTYRQFGECN